MEIRLLGRFLAGFEPFPAGSSPIKLSSTFALYFVVLARSGLSFPNIAVPFPALSFSMEELTVTGCGDLGYSRRVANVYDMEFRASIIFVC